jgi:hypothetical protein
LIAGFTPPSPGNLSGRRCFRSVDDGTGELGESAVARAAGTAQQGERLVHIEVAAFGDDALGLPDEDAAVECGRKLSSRRVCSVEVATTRKCAAYV